MVCRSAVPQRGTFAVLMLALVSGTALPTPENACLMACCGTPPSHGLERQQAPFLLACGPLGVAACCRVWELSAKVRWPVSLLRCFQPAVRFGPMCSDRGDRPMAEALVHAHACTPPLVRGALGSAELFEARLGYW